MDAGHVEVTAEQDETSQLATLGVHKALVVLEQSKHKYLPAPYPAATILSLRRKMDAGHVETIAEQDNTSQLATLGVH